MDDLGGKHPLFLETSISIEKMEFQISKYSQMSQGSGEYIPFLSIFVWVEFQCPKLELASRSSPSKSFCLPCFFLACERCYPLQQKKSWLGWEFSHLKHGPSKGYLRNVSWKTSSHVNNSSRCKMASPICWWGFLLGIFLSFTADLGKMRPGHMEKKSPRDFWTPQTSRDGSYDEMYSWRMARDPLKIFLVNSVWCYQRNG